MIVPLFHSWIGTGGLEGRANPIICKNGAKVEYSGLHIKVRGGRRDCAAGKRGACREEKREREAVQTGGPGGGLQVKKRSELIKNDKKHQK